MTNQLSTCVNRVLFDAKVLPKNDKLSSKFSLKLYDNDDYLNTDENVSWVNNYCLESDESNSYDSDCSLGSMNSLYLDNFSNETRRKGTNHSYSNDNLNKDGQTPTNSIFSTKTQISTKTKNENESSTKKLDVIRFYGQRTYTQHLFSLKLLKIRRSEIQRTCFKLCRPTFPAYKFKQNMNKLHNSFKSMYHHCQLKKMSTTKQKFKKDEKLICNKPNIPLIKLNHQTVNMTAQENTNHGNLMKKNPSLDFNDIQREFIELNGSDIVNDFMDDDDFKDPRIADTIDRLFNDSSFFDENKINGHYEVQMYNMNYKITEQKYGESYTSCNEH